MTSLLSSWKATKVPLNNIGCRENKLKGKGKLASCAQTFSGSNVGGKTKVFKAFSSLAPQTQGLNLGDGSVGHLVLPFCNLHYKLTKLSSEAQLCFSVVSNRFECLRLKVNVVGDASAQNFESLRISVSRCNNES